MARGAGLARAKSYAIHSSWTGLSWRTRSSAVASGNFFHASPTFPADHRCWLQNPVRL